MGNLLRKKTSVALERAGKLDAIARPWGIEIADRLLRLKEKLGRPELKIAFVGRFKSGKSTLINALLGEDLLPYDVLPCTACEVYVSYGQSPVFRIEDGEGNLVNVPRGKLGDYVSREGQNPARRAEVALPHPMLEQGICFIDTPGFEDISQTRSEVVYGVLPEADAIIMVFDMSAISEAEIRFLRERVFSSTLSRFIFVINRIDMHTDGEVAEVTEYLRGLLEPYLADPVIVPISARQHLEKLSARANQPVTDTHASAEDRLVSADGDPRFARLIEVLQENVIAERDCLLAKGIDYEVQGAVQCVEQQLGALLESLSRNVEEEKEHLQALEEELADLREAAKAGEQKSREQLEAVMHSFRNRLDEFVSKYRTLLKRRILVESVENLRRTDLLAEAIELQFKNWLEEEAQRLEEEISGVLEEHDVRLRERLSSARGFYAGDDLALSGKPIPEGIIVPGILLAGWLTLGWFNFIVLAAGAGLCGDYIKKAIVELVDNPERRKQEFAEKVAEKIQGIHDRVGAQVCTRIQQEFDRRLSSRREEFLGRLDARKRLLMQQHEIVDASQQERDDKARLLERSRVELKELLRT